MDVELVGYTKDALDILIFSRNTRLLSNTSGISEIKNLRYDIKLKKLDQIRNTINSSWEFVDYTFVIRGVTRAFTHQLVRHRAGTSFAQQSLRAVDMGEFDYLDLCDHREYHLAMDHIRSGYKNLIGDGVSVQKARGILPTNILTNILFKCNLRTLNNVMNVRLCVRTQGEFQNVAITMKKEILKVHNWAESFLEVYCVQHGICCFLNYRDCPLKKSGVVKDISSDKKSEIKKSWQSLDYEADPLERTDGE